MAKSAHPTPPKALGSSGRALWKRIVGDLPDGWRFDERELRALEQACRCADDAAGLEEEIARDGYVVAGSKGQLRPHPGLDTVIRLRNLEAQLLRRLELEPPAPKTAAQARAERAAEIRWTARTRRGAHA